MPDPSERPPAESLGSHYQGLLHLAQSADRREKLSEMENYRQAIERNPQNAEGYARLASGYKSLGQDAKGIEVLAEGLERCPPAKDLYREYIRALKRGNRTEAGIRAAEECLRAFPEAEEIRLMKRLMLPILYDKREDIDHYRGRYLEELAAFCRETNLDEEAGRAKALCAVRDWANFYLAYQGRNDRDPQREYGQLLGRVMAASYPQWAGPAAMPPWAPGDKLRIGYVSARFYWQSVMKNHLGWLLGHDKSKVEVYAYYVGTKVDSTTEEAKRSSVRFVHAPGGLEGACEAIARDRLHVLVFLDIGMSPIMGMMGALRLAPVQCVTWGHPMTSGLDTIDYFLSSDLMEPDNGQEHYCEQLIRLPGMGIWYRKPVIPRPLLLKKRSDFGLRDDAVAYWSCQSLFKYLPQYDHVFAEIAARVPAAQFVFVAFNELVAADFRKRLERAFSKEGLSAGRHCVILPQMHQLEYWNGSLVCDVYLDTMGWSGCNTTIEAMACGLPVVTMPGEFMRGRHSYAILTQLGVTETIARHPAEYVDLAVRLGLDGEWRRSIVARMREQAARIYADRSCVQALEEFYERVVVERLQAGSEAGRIRG